MQEYTAIWTEYNKYLLSVYYVLGIGGHRAIQTLPLWSWLSGKDGKGKRLVSDAGMENTPQTSSEEGTAMVTSHKGAGEGFTEEAASELWSSF